MCRAQLGQPNDGQVQIRLATGSVVKQGTAVLLVVTSTLNVPDSYSDMHSVKK